MTWKRFASIMRCALAFLLFSGQVHANMFAESAMALNRWQMVVSSLDQLEGVDVLRWQTISSELDHFETAPGIAFPSGVSAIRAPLVPVDVSSKNGSPAKEFALSQIADNVTRKGDLRVEMGSSVILKGSNIQRSLLIDPKVVSISVVDRERVLITGQQRGTTFLHLWDDSGRWTIYVDSTLPSNSGASLALGDGRVERSTPFRLSYSNDWGSYHLGPSLQSLERRSIYFLQKFLLEGGTPYGMLDASTSLNKDDTFSNLPNYTVGLSNVPAPFLDDLDLRFFDATRSLSPLTLTSVSLRGVFLDAAAFSNTIALSLSHGREQNFFGYSIYESPSKRDAFVDAGRLVFMPQGTKDRYALNVATGHGQDRAEGLTDIGYSVEALRHISETVSLNAELARDEKDVATIGAMQWDQEPYHVAISARDIDKDFTTVTGASGGQGSQGVLVSGDMMSEDLSFGGSADIYRDRVSLNPDDPQAFNLDSSTYLRYPISERQRWDVGLRYLYTPGLSNVTRSTALESRLSQEFDVWGDRLGTIYAGGSAQRSRYPGAPESEFDRCSAVVGGRLPLTDGLLCFVNYEYSWLREPFSGLRSNPNVLNTGISYSKDFTKMISGNMAVTYRNEEDIRGVNSFLSGEDSVSSTVGLSYQPRADMNFFVDGSVRDIWAQVDDKTSYFDADIRMGMRMALGLGVQWDPWGIIAGYIFIDDNRNGRMDKDEEGLSGVKVAVGDKEVPVNGQGWYSTSVRARKVLVRPVLETLPSGMSVSGQPPGLVDVINAGARRVNIALISYTGIFGLAFEDKNGNGSFDPGERPLSRVKIVLDGDMFQQTDGRGGYAFNNIAPGKHKLNLDMMTLPKEMIPLIKVNNELDVAEGASYRFNIPMRLKEVPDAPEVPAIIESPAS